VLGLSLEVILKGEVKEIFRLFPPGRIPRRPCMATHSRETLTIFSRFFMDPAVLDIDMSRKFSFNHRL
jgi:hypothetical protein